MKRKIIAVILTGLMVFSASSCGKKPAPSSAPEENTSNSDTPEDTSSDISADNTLTVWTWDPNFNIYAINKAAELYAADGHEVFHVDITEIESQDIETKLTTIANAGELDALPDIFLIQDASFQKFAQNYPEIFTDLTDSDIDFSQFSAAKTSYSIETEKIWESLLTAELLLTAYARIIWNRPDSQWKILQILHGLIIWKKLK